MNDRNNIPLVSNTPAAAELIDELKKAYGDLMFHQSGGCCDGSAPMCYVKGEFKTGESDILLGEIEGCPFYIGKEQYKAWSHTLIIIDVIEGRGSGFSLEAPRGVRFLSRSRIFTPEELSMIKQNKTHQ